MSNVFVPKVEVVTIKGESVDVHDPSLKSVLSLLRNAKPVLDKLMSMGSGSGSAVDNFITLLAEPEVFEGFKQAAKACTGKDAEFFDDIGISDTASLVGAMQTAVNWGVLKELFRKAVPAIVATPTN